jgi:hypothetical protein
MRAFLFVVALIAAAWALDVTAFDGRYSRAAWQEARDRGRQLNSDIAHFLKKTGLAR